MNKGTQVVVVGAPHEVDQIQPLIELDGVTNLLHLMTIGRMMAVIEDSNFVLANDSAALHMAVGFKRKCVGLFGPTNPKKVGPYNYETSVIAADVDYDEVQYRNCVDNQIMQQIETNEVISRLEAIGGAVVE